MRKTTSALAVALLAGGTVVALATPVFADEPAVNQPPSASFTLSDTRPGEPDTDPATFYADATSTTDDAPIPTDHPADDPGESGTYNSWQWTLTGPGDYRDVLYGETLWFKAWGGPGDYMIELEVTDAGGLKDTETKTFTVPPVVVNEPPHANFSIGIAGDKNYRTFDFNARDSSDPEGDGLTYAWRFGDGTTGTGVYLKHTFPAKKGKTYSVTLTVTDEAGNTDTMTGQVHVK